MAVIGIDPGLSGAIALLDDGDGIDVFDMPVLELARSGKKRREIDPTRLDDLIRSLRGNRAVLEQAGSRPGQGVASSFAFGKGYGLVLGILVAHGIPYTVVHPTVWKKALHVPAGKDAARARASQLFPGSAQRWTRAKDDGRAEAALIALWGRRHG